MKKFFDYIQLPNFDVASDAAATFKVIHDPFGFFYLAAVSLTSSLFCMYHNLCLGT